MSTWIGTILVVVGSTAVVALFIGAMEHSDKVREARDAEYERMELEGPCHDESWLLATTAGSPDSAKCKNRLHRMRVQVATTPSREEVGALVFCECVRTADGGGP